jgi:hypothetical protein
VSNNSTKLFDVTEMVASDMQGIILFVNGCVEYIPHNESHPSGSQCNGRKHLVSEISTQLLHHLQVHIFKKSGITFQVGL